MPAVRTHLAPAEGGPAAAAEPLADPPDVAFPAVTEVTRVVSGQALVAYRGNFYSIGPGMSGATVHLRHGSVSRP